ncbi:TasA family protein [Enterococcus sp. BWR-S5]|uniref:TasA family protein n=1 Tax=Enterococcus sp. BWR-S5 TaxID=2787714 RepID=UPI001921DCD1|nr:TasA family protein [Enterococcus sp. BWR-S5]MBL1226778.1 hypothetical protein [Enterococcus sp. BWR-S5]
MKNLRKNKKFVTGASAALTVLMLAAGTFAWYSAQHSVENKFKTDGMPDGSVKVWEIFDEEKGKEAKPGEKIQKDVGVTNLGDNPVFVRASFEEMVHKYDADGLNLAVEKSTTIKADADLEANGGAFLPVPIIDTTSWSDPATLGFTVDASVPAGVTVKMKELTTSSASNSYEVIAYSTQNGQVGGEWKIDSDAKTISVTDVTYNYYKRTSTAATFNWTVDILEATAPAAFQLDEKINLIYHTANVDNTTPTANKWYFNAADGWFYYIGLVDSGNVTPLLLNAVQIDGSAGNNYMYMDYTLTVKAEALQGYQEALSDWSGVTGALKTALEAVAPAAP